MAAYNYILGSKLFVMAKFILKNIILLTCFRNATQGLWISELKACNLWWTNLSFEFAFCWYLQNVSITQKY